MTSWELDWSPTLWGDTGFELAFCISAISSAIFRTLEKKRFGRVEQGKFG